MRRANRRIVGHAGSRADRSTGRVRCLARPPLAARLQDAIPRHCCLACPDRRGTCIWTWGYGEHAFARRCCTDGRRCSCGLGNWNRGGPSRCCRRRASNSDAGSAFRCRHQARRQCIAGHQLTHDGGRLHALQPGQQLRRLGCNRAFVLVMASMVGVLICGLLLGLAPERLLLPILASVLLISAWKVWRHH